MWQQVRATINTIFGKRTVTKIMSLLGILCAASAPLQPFGIDGLFFTGVVLLVGAALYGLFLEDEED
jgi:putative copper export protein